MNKRIIQSILDNAPEGATHVSNYYLMRSDKNPWGKYLYYWYDRDGEMWLEASIDVGFRGNVRLLSDLQTQLDQLNEIERLKSAIEFYAKLNRTAEFKQFAYDNSELFLSLKQQEPTESKVDELSHQSPELLLKELNK